MDDPGNESEKGLHSGGNEGETAVAKDDTELKPAGEPAESVREKEEALIAFQPEEPVAEAEVLEYGLLPETETGQKEVIPHLEIPKEAMAAETEIPQGEVIPETEVPQPEMTVSQNIPEMEMIPEAENPVEEAESAAGEIPVPPEALFQSGEASAEPLRLQDEAVEAEEKEPGDAENSIAAEEVNDTAATLQEPVDMVEAVAEEHVVAVAETDLQGGDSGVKGTVPGLSVPEEQPVAEEAKVETTVEMPAGKREQTEGESPEIHLEEEVPAAAAEPQALPDAVEPAAGLQEPASMIEEKNGEEVKDQTVASKEEGEPSGDGSAEEPGEEDHGVSHVTEELMKLSQEELVQIMRKAVEANGESEYNIDAVVAVFFQKSKEKNQELKRNFLASGGKPEEFVQEEDPDHQEVRDLLKRFRQLRFEQSKRLDAEKEANLRKKYEIIEEIKNLLNKEESINRTFQEFRDLQRKWYDIGPVPQAKMKDLWDTYHFHVENFYDYIKINKELRDLDLKKNLEAKILICEKAEELLMEPSVLRAFNALQKFHDEWREVGPVPTDKKDEIWERFKAATSQINQKHQDYFEKRKAEQKKNLDAKVALCEKAEEIASAVLESHRDWDEKSKELVELQKVWKTIGFAPKRDNNKIYNRFREACDKFFTNKREYYSRNKDVQQTNLQMKVDLCMEAETLKESTDWKKATQQFIDIQRRWKEIGPVPRKSSDAIWKRFRAACDFFFERKSAHFSDIDGEQYENLKLKEQIIQEVDNFSPDEDPSESLRMLRDFQRRWTEIGHVPIKNKDVIQKRFRDAINKHFDALKIDSSNRTSFDFRNKIESLADNARGLMKVRSEREKYMIKLKQLETDYSLLENNIGFFANSKNAQALIADVNQKIQETKEKIQQLKEKIRIIDELDKSEY